MTIQKRVQKWLGIADVLELAAKHDRQLSVFSEKLEQLRDVQKWLGIADVLELAAKRDRQLSVFSEKLEQLRDEDLRLRKLVAEKFADLLPASPEFIDEIRKQLELKIDVATGTMERIGQQLVRANR